ncbi:hypothetical protein TrCOL_g12266 [Triparma columacea]|nr:hypothetical protein TrCOL_g12266 [Triparma columacea]
MGEITLNPVPDGALGKKSLPPHLARVQTFKSESRAALAKPFARTLSKEETSLGGEVVSKHKKVEKRATILNKVKDEEGGVGTDNETWLKRHDSTSRHDFYENTATGETQWTKPQGSNA